MEEYTFKKSTCERYDIRWKPYGWAIITIDENGGMFSAQSDFGNYAYSWPNHGRESFKHFILELARDSHYFLGKVAKENYFDSNKALDRWKSKIIEIRKDRDCTQEQARDAWDFINDLDLSLSKDYLEVRMYESDAINAICEEPWYVFDMDLDYSPQANAFAYKVMPMFADILKEDLRELMK